MTLRNFLWLLRYTSLLLAKPNFCSIYYAMRIFFSEFFHISDDLHKKIASSESSEKNIIINQIERKALRHWRELFEICRLCFSVIEILEIFSISLSDTPFQGFICTWFRKNKIDQSRSNLEGAPLTRFSFTFDFYKI